MAFAREGAKVVLVYKKTARTFDENKFYRCYAANAGNADFVKKSTFFHKIFPKRTQNVHSEELYLLIKQYTF